MSKEKIVAIKIFINLIFISFITWMIFLLYTHNIERDTIYTNTIKRLQYNLNQIELLNVSNSIYNSIEFFNSSLESDIKSSLNSDEFIAEYKDIENIDNSKLFHIIKKNVYKTNIKKNSLMIGTKDIIIYNNSLDRYNMYQWSNFLDNKTINDLMSGNVEKIYVKYEDEKFYVVDEHEIINVIINEPEKLQNYDLFIPSQITSYGDIVGNSDIQYDGKNSISEYKMLILYRENMLDIYKSDLINFKLLDTISFDYYYDYLTIFVVIIIWFMYVITLDKTNKLAYIIRLKFKDIKK